MQSIATPPRIGLLALFAAASLAGIVHAHAAIEVTAEQRAACTPDALRLCSSEIPDVARVTTCMKANEANLSARCRATIPGATVGKAAPRVPVKEERQPAKDAQPRPHEVAGATTRRVTHASTEASVAHARHRHVEVSAVAAHPRHRHADTRMVEVSYSHHHRHGSLGFSYGEAAQYIGMARQIMGRVCQSPSAPAEVCSFGF